MEDVNINKVTLDNALAISSLTQVVNRTSRDVDKLIKHTEKIDTILVGNSKLEKRVGDLEEVVDSDRKAIDIVYTIAKYPKITVSVLVFSYLFTLDEVRTVLYNKIEPLLILLRAVGG